LIAFLPHHIQELYTFKNGLGFFWPILYMVTQKGDPNAKLYRQYFIWSNTDVLHFVTVKYSLQQSDKTVLY